MNRKVIITALMAAVILPLVAIAQAEPTAYVDLGPGPIKLLSAHEADNPDASIPIRFTVAMETDLATGTRLDPGAMVIEGDELASGTFINDFSVPVRMHYSDPDGEHSVVLHPGEALKVGAILLNPKFCPYVSCHCCNDWICLADPVNIPTTFPFPIPTDLYPRNGQACEIPGAANGKLQDCKYVLVPCLAEKTVFEPVWRQKKK